MGDLEQAGAAADSEFSGSGAGEPCQECKPKTYLIMVADRAVGGTLGLFYHYSLEFWMCDADVTLNENWDVPDFEEAHPGSAKIAAVELLRQGGYSAHNRRQNWRGTMVWVEESVGVSVVHYSSTSANVLPLFKGSQQEVKAKWDTIVAAAQSYPYAEQEGFDGTFKNWPNSIYLIGNDVNNSNTFVRMMVKAAGLSMVEMTGSHPGRNEPQPITDAYSTPWPSDQEAPPPPS